jgi:hypothetical protein
MKKNIVVALIFLLVLAGMTFPLVLKLNTAIAGFFSTDELSLTGTDLISAPAGVSFFSAGYIPYLWLAWHHILSFLLPVPVSLNIELLFNMFLSAFFTYLLVRYLTGNRLSGLLSGIIFGFCPYQFMRLWQHVSLTYTQWLPLVLYLVISMRKKKNARVSGMFLLSLLGLCSFDFVTAFFGHIVLASYLVYSFAHLFREKTLRKQGIGKQEFSYWKRVFIVWGIAMILLSPQFYPLIKNSIRFSHTTQASAYNPFRRSFDDLFSQSARPLSYFLPAVVHPFFGKFTEPFVGGGFYGESFTEHTLYLGWVPLVLAFFAFRVWRKRHKQLPVSGIRRAEDPESFYIGYFLFLAAAAWFFSQPPWWKWGSLKIYMPSFFMYKILPMYRAYCRFGIVVMLAIAVLAGFGLKFLMERFHSRITRMVVAALACILVLFEFWNWPPYKVIDVSRMPAVYYWLKEQPGDFVIAEYPLDAKGPTDIYKLYQIVHQKKMINSTTPGTRANDIVKAMIRLSQPRTAGMLKGLGVKYVLVHQEGDAQGEISEEMEEMKKVPQNPGLKLVKTFPAQSCSDSRIMCVEKTGIVDVYEVVADPVSAEPLQTEK